MRLANGVLVHQVIDDSATVGAGPASATLTATKATFLASLVAPERLPDLAASGDLQVDGDSAAWPSLLGLLDSVDPSLEIVLH